MCTNRCSVILHSTLAPTIWVRDEYEADYQRQQEHDGKNSIRACHPKTPFPYFACWFRRELRRGPLYACPGGTARNAALRGMIRHSASIIASLD